MYKGLHFGPVYKLVKRRFRISILTRTNKSTKVTKMKVAVVVALALVILAVDVQGGNTYASIRAIDIGYKIYRVTCTCRIAVEWCKAHPHACKGR
ncbi:hypothetical protein RRG08_063563 [Elysia crispata]|uniref:Uncharacterized protein n=1 Tax=Elysia crispata TaxID=231223 RepID=A0AAE0ZD69_9GAST|nr:hypothetical protein RRG08_063563 [Elysia crispata]